MLPLFMILAWILTTAMLCKSIVYEKDRRLKEIMKIMGLGNGVHWMAWFINAFVMMFLTNLLLVILLKVLALNKPFSGKTWLKPIPLTYVF
ncbi:hypothetical protein DPMN_131030 [Dreissena polymorpha]|uniref:Uncharacterized protein n=1 Tax=Dreissena polymorpha TaxID=45954 RepID=A0A9D4K1Q3_DREPO|nr:hypothetical protein DPMN_131030 [Dreissena polymorpha]